MKKMLLMGIVFLGIFVTVQAQDSPLKEYLGKYTFAEKKIGGRALPANLPITINYRNENGNAKAFVYYTEILY